MSPNRLNRAVAHVTGESVGEIRRRGFGPADPFEPEFDPEPDERSPQLADGDAPALARLAILFAK